MPKQDDKVVSIGFDEKEVEEPEEEKENVVEKENPIRSKPGWSLIPIISGAIGICYSAYFEIAFLLGGKVTSYFPWRWNATYANFSQATELFLLSLGIVSAVLVTGILLRVRFPATMSSTPAPNNAIAPGITDQTPVQEDDGKTLFELIDDLEQSETELGSLSKEAREARQREKEMRVRIDGLKDSIIRQMEIKGMAEKFEALVEKRKQEKKISSVSKQFPNTPNSVLATASPLPKLSRNSSVACEKLA